MGYSVGIITASNNENSRKLKFVENHDILQNGIIGNKGVT